MNVEQINKLLSRGEVDREDMWPRIVEYESKAAVFPFEFGLKELPQEPGLITIRGPRQYGKSTWLDLELRDSIIEFGAGSAFYLNGDNLYTHEELYQALIKLDASYAPSAKVKRLFIDEITAIPDWPRAIKRAIDQGHLRDVLIVTTGSKATDLRRGAERLPGRKGKLARTDYIFLPVSYNAFYENCHRELGEDTWIAYLLAGGSPLGCNDIYQFERIPEYLIQLVRDWIFGEIVASGRNRISIGAILTNLFRYGGTPLGFTKLAQQSGLANNTVASGHMEQLSDLMSVLPAWAYDASKKVLVLRKPAKFHFINLAAAIAFHPKAPRQIHEFKALPRKEQAVLLEWLVAQELWRRNVLAQTKNPEALGYWQSDTHEIDFVDPQGTFVEVKLGQASALEFSWFEKVFPKQKLQVVCSTPFEARSVRGLTIEDFLNLPSN